MAESLRRLVNIGSFTSLQEKLERWLDDYHVLTCDQNVARGCEIIELNSRLQGQLFKLLSITASEGGLYGGASTIKARLLPLLGANFFTGTATADTTLSLLSENAAKDRELNDLEDTYERSLVTLEDDLKATQLENDDLKNELADTQDELDKSQRMSTSEKMFTEQEIRDLRAKVTRLETENSMLRRGVPGLPYLPEYDHLRKYFHTHGVDGRWDQLPSSVWHELMRLKDLKDPEAIAKGVTRLETENSMLRRGLPGLPFLPEYDHLRKYFHSYGVDGRWNQLPNSVWRELMRLKDLKDPDAIAKGVTALEAENALLLRGAPFYGTLNYPQYDRQMRNLREEIAILTGKRNSLAAIRDTASTTGGSVNGFNDSQNEVMRLRLQLSESDATIRRLRDDVIISTGRVPYITTSDVNDSLASYRYLPRVSSPLHSDDTTQRVRQQSLISRFNDMFSQDRLDAMDILRRYSDDHENNQRIVFVAMQEAFSVAKLAFRQFKIKVRSQLAGTHLGPDTLEEAVQDYINRNTDLYDLPALVSDVIRALNRNPKLYLQPTASYTVIQTFIREACKLAWQMSALAHPLDIAIATDAELFDEFKYRRSYDSEYTAPLVNHHIWPCLQQSTKVLMKGEANTRRGASLGSPRRSRSPTRSMSPVRSYSPTRSVSPSRRSPSPRRTLSSLGDSFSGRSSPSGMRSLSRSSLRSSSPSRLY